VLPPDVNKSQWSFAPDGEAIRFGLGAVKNLGQGAVDSILAARNENGAFKNFYQFAESVDLTAVNRRAIESLIKAGALDNLDGTRSQLFAAIDRAMDHGTKARRDKESGQGGLFGDLFGAAEEEAVAFDLPRVPDWARMQKLQGEKEILGFYVTGHPLDEFEDRICDLRTHETDQLMDLPRNTEVKLCGILTGIQRRRSREGKLWISLNVEDHKGVLEGMIFNGRDNDRLIEDLSPHLTEDNACLITAQVSPEEGAPPKLRVKDLLPLKNARLPLPSLISIRVRLVTNGHDPVQELRELFDRKKGEAQVRLRLEAPRDFAVLLDISDRVRPDREFRKAVEQICGAESLEILQ
jgi:DNA polymerase-3 subunit alpha